MVNEYEKYLEELEEKKEKRRVGTKKYAEQIEKYERMKKEKAAKREEARKVKLARIEKATTKRLKMIGKRIKGVDITKTPKAYRELQKAIGRKKVSSAEIKARRAHELKMAKLKHQQRMQYLQAQADLAARETDQRYAEDRGEDQFLSEIFEETPRENYDYEYPEEQRVGVGRKILNGFGNFGRGINKLGSRFESRIYPIPDTRHLPIEMRRELKRRGTILNQQNIFNKPKEIGGNTKISLMSSERTKPKAQRLNFWRA